MLDIERKFERLEARIRELEDQLAIQQLIARYGPAVDSCSAEATAALWAEDGSYDFGGEPLQGAAAVGSLVDLPSHRTYVERGCVHALGPVVIAIDGDKAVATGNSRVYLRDGAAWKVERAGANRWELIRTAGGWRVAKRINRLADGSDAAPELLRTVVNPVS